MDVSSSTSSASIQTTVQKQAQDVQAQQTQQATKVVEDASEQAQDVSSQKTGIGRSLNITG